MYKWAFIPLANISKKKKIFDIVDPKSESLLITTKINFNYTDFINHSLKIQECL